MGIALSFSVVFSASAATNEWTKPSSGAWEEPFWSLGEPSTAHEAVAIWNPGWKAVAIGANTASPVLNNLIIDAPTNSANRLLLNWAGLNDPLVVRSNLLIGANGSLVSHFSALQAANVELQGFAAFSDHATAGLDKITLRSGGALNLNEAYLTCSNLGFWGGSVTQSVGVAAISRIDTFEQYWAPSPPRIDNAYVLSGGVLVSGVAEVGHYGLTGSDDFAFLQSGGAHTNTSMTVWGGQRRFQLIDHAGHYSLSSGLLVSEQTTVMAGLMDQSGGTNLTRELVVAAGGIYTLNNGQLVTSNTTVGTVDCLQRGFDQNGGSHTVQNRLVLGNAAFYSLSAGTLRAPVIEIHTAAGLAVGGGEVSNSGMLVLRRGSLGVGAVSQQFGKLQVLDSDDLGCFAEPHIPAVISMGSSTDHGVLRFQDSRDVPWAGTLQIRSWTGTDRIFIGTNAQGLTSAQLQRIIFVNPGGFAAGNYPAQILSNGEIVPNANQPTLGHSTTSRPLVLSWNGNYSLWTTTNLLGTWTVIPGATSPYTNSFTDPQRFFHLRSPTP